MIDLLLLAQGISLDALAAVPESPAIEVQSVLLAADSPPVEVFPDLPDRFAPESAPLYGTWQGLTPASSAVALPKASLISDPLVAQSSTMEPDEALGEEAAEGDSGDSPQGSEDVRNPEDVIQEGIPLPVEDLAQLGVVELVADRQEYDRLRQWVSARGNVYLRFNGGELTSDRLDFNLNTQILRAEGNVVFNRGRQRLEGDRLDYNLLQETGQIFQAQGELSSLTSAQDLNLNQPLSSPTSIEASPLRDIRVQGGIEISSGFGTGLGTERTEDNLANRNTQFPVELSTFRQKGTVTHWRFRAEQVDLYPDGWVAEAARLTNDPFNPPQFAIRTRRLRYQELTPLISELRADRPRFLFENFLPLPTFRNRVLFDRRPQDSGLFSIGFDNDDRGGLYIERSFEPLSNDRFRLTLTPQLLIQEAFAKEGGNLLSPNALGFESQFQANLHPQTQISGSFSIPQLGSNTLEDEIRASVRGTQNLPYAHRLNLEYSYRDRLFNGSLGIQTVQQSLGVVLQSPPFRLGSSGVIADYQVGAQWINAETDRPDLLEPLRKNDRIDLGRYQITAGVSKGFPLWQGKPLESTEAALRYSPRPIVPGLFLNLSSRGTYSLYSNGDTQEALVASVNLTGELGHFSRPWFDYTRFNVGYSQAFRNHQSPFKFDRFNDSQVLTLGFTQQVYGPIRIGFETSLNVVTSEDISTDYRIEYSRRAFNAELRYNPVLGLGSINFRIHDFDWKGQSEPL